MKLHIFCYLMLAVPVACNDQGTAPPQIPLANLFEIHLQNGFFNTDVSVSVDRTQVFHSTVSTVTVLSVAAIIPVQVTQGAHRLGVTVGATPLKDTTFSISDTLFVGVNYDAATSAINYRFQRNRFYYR